MAKRKAAASKGASKKQKVEVDEDQDDSTQYEVEEIISHKQLANGDFEYKVRWVGYTEEDDTWETEENLVASSKQLITDYKKDNLLDSNGGDFSEDDDDEPVSKKKPAKKTPKKTPAKKTPKKSTPAVTPSRESGRPRKSVTYNDDENDDEEYTNGNDEYESSSKKKSKGAKKTNNKRGRPKKSNDHDDSDDGEETTEEYEVEKIIDVHFSKKGKEYLVRWKGWSSKDDTWEPEAHLNCADLIEAFNVKLEKIKSSTSQKALRVDRKKKEIYDNSLDLDKKRQSRRTAGQRKNYADDEYLD